MGDWASYSLSDFLLFSPRAYWRLFELNNADWWPLPLVTLAAGLATWALAIRRPRLHAGSIVLILAVLWAWVAWSFFWQRYAAINWAATYVAPAFVLQAVLLAVVAWSGRLACDLSGARGLIGFLLIALALIIYPLLAPAFGRPWTEAGIFGMAPDPTAIGTLGFLLLMRGKGSALLLLVPLAWCVASGVTLWTMQTPEAWIAPLATLAAIAVCVLRRRPAGDQML